jgi:putative ABC transport system permease protein
MSRTPLSERVFRALLRVFPAEFRGDFGEQMAEDFRDQREEARQRGYRRVVRLWVRMFGDSLRQGPREHFDILRRDASYALRLLRRRPGLAASAVVTLAIGIGLNAAVFSLVNSVMWRDLAIPGGDRLVRLYEVTPPPDAVAGSVSADNFLDWQARAKNFDAMATIAWDRLTLVGSGDPEELPAARVSNGFFRVAPIRPALGRLFNESDYAPLAAALKSRAPRSDDDPPEPSVAIITHALWLRQFQGRPDVIGTTVRLGRGTVEVVGVLAAGFAFPGWEETEVWLPRVLEPVGRRARYLSAFGRLGPGVSLQQAQAELDVIAGQLASAFPRANKGWGIRSVGLLDSMTEGIGIQLWFLFGAAGCVLLIACANVANLLLAHAVGRRHELATRVALGASRAHLVRQAVTEGLLLAAAGGAAGLALAYWFLPLIVRLAPGAIPRLSEVAVDGRALVFTAATSLLVGLGCGLAGWLRPDHATARGVLRSAGPAARQGRRLRQALTVSEIAVALMLVVATGLLVRTVRTVGGLELGFDPSNVISIGLTPDIRQYAGPAKVQFESDLIARVRSLPGVVAAGIGSRPLGEGTFGTVVTLAESPGQEIPMSLDVVGAGYLDALGARLTNGRAFDARDVAGAPQVALVNAAGARRLWSGQAAVGRFLAIEDHRIEVVGVVADVRRKGLEADVEPTLYLPSAQQLRFSTGNMLVRTQSAPEEIMPAIRAIMRQVDRNQALTRVQTLAARLAEALAPRRQMLWLVGLFSMMALGLALVGVYGVMAESVAQRVPEIGVRMALGATGSDVVQLVLRQGSLMIALGLMLGIAGAAALNRVMAGFVFRVSTTDPGTFAVACMCLTAATLAACVVPAARASRIDPVLALRQE